MRIGIGYDVHKFAESRRLILCGEDIPYHLGLLGHSDADVATHALMDAILGALALGDIGRHFPDTDEKYSGISSILLLSYVASLIKEHGYKLGNADIIIIAEAPKLSPYVAKMRENIAIGLNTWVGNISVKATTTEKLGFCGRGEGIAAQAVCLLRGKSQ